MSAFYDQASLVVVPSGYKSGKIYAQKPLTTDGQLTFTRASNATRVASNGLIEKVRTNLLLQSNTFSTTWTNTTSTETSGQAGYDGTNNAWLLEKTNFNGRVEQTISASGLLTFSVYAKAGTDNFLFLRVDGSGGLHTAYFDLVNGTVGITALLVASSITAAGNGYYRCSISLNDTITIARIYVADANGDTSGTSGNIYIQDSQLEAGDIATDYIATTSAAVSVGPVSGLPRLDYLNSSCPRLLLEPQRTNLALFSEQFDNAVWTKTRATITANAGTSPDGYTNADKFVEDSTNNSKFIQQSVAVADSSVYTLSVFAKAQERNQIALVSRDKNNAFLTTIFGLTAGTIVTQGHSTAKVEDYGNGWYRCSVQFNTNTGGSSVIMYLQTALNGALSYQGNGTSGLLIYGAQWELGSYVSSYLNTLSTSVTRVADAATKTLGTSYFPSTGFSVFIDFDVTYDTVTSFADIFKIIGSTTQFRIETRINGVIYMQQANIVTSGDNFNSWGLCPATAKKLCFTFSPTQVKAYVDGALSATFDGVYTFTPIDTLNLPIETSAVSHKQTLLFGSVLTDAQAIELTA